MDENAADINAVIRRLEDKLALQVECDDPDANLSVACDIQALINSYRTINIAWAQMYEVNDHNKTVIDDYAIEVKKLNDEIATLRKCID
jgi:hypothetical protein